jgi:vitamin B12 transporter
MSWWSQRLTLAQAHERLFAVSGNVGRNLNTGGTIIGNPNCSLPNLDTCFTPFSLDIRILNRRLEWQHNFEIGKPLLLTAGYQFREDQGENPGSFGAAQPNKLISSHAGFAQAQVNLWDRLFLTGGVRQDSYNVFGDATTYRATGGYLVKETGTKLRASYATGFKAPTLNDLFFQGFGNPNLKPEKSRSMDAGIDQSLVDGRVQLTAGYFWNRFRDLIQFASSFSPLCPASSFGFCPINVAEAKTQGWELGFKATIVKGLDVKGRYTYTLTRAFDTPINPLGGDKRLPRWPVDQAMFGLAYQPVEAALINVDYRFVGARNNDLANSPSQRQGSFGVVNASATYDVTRNWQVFGRIENLLNQKYEEVLFFGTPIRSVFGGIRFTY